MSSKGPLLDTTYENTLTEKPDEFTDKNIEVNEHPDEDADMLDMRSFLIYYIRQDYMKRRLN